MKKNRQFFHSFKEASTSYAHAYIGAHTYDPIISCAHTAHIAQKRILAYISEN